MIQVNEISCVKEESIEFDEYVPITVRWGANERSFDKVLYWRTGDFKKSLFEMGISEQDGGLVSFTLTLIDSEKVKISENHEGVTSSIQGLPLFNKDTIFNDSVYFDDITDIKVEVSNNSFSILFDQLPIVSHIQNGRVRFGLTEQKLLAKIEVSDISKSEHEKLKLALNI
ncbi:hypothetical protein ABD76_01220 [Paenibacillus dendritiformis]|uniref:hypothetical protein n=1 Tax=Paenibacillus dendritiformis TaxID=130049 RepID=UPI0018CED9DB|nr:hypothetical protein [Paenibacillus dendritiformis]MBG9791229.1 hypothetical protein [Paenibacillus dendritiformis]